MREKMTLSALQHMKEAGRKIAAVVVYDYQMAQIVDRAGVDMVSVGDSVGVQLWGHGSQVEVTVDQMVLVCQAVRRGVSRALVSCDVPYGPLQESPDAAVAAAGKLVKEGGADLIKLDGASSCPAAVEAITRTGIPVWAQFGLTPHTAPQYDSTAALEVAARITDQLVAEARLLEDAGASMLDFTHSGPVAGSAVVRAVAIPVLGGLGGGPWLDGRVRSLVAAIGYAASAVDDRTARYANVAAITLGAIQLLCEDVRSARQLRGQRDDGGY
jgi:3-methyl-2-oxobutanoate hydroxymethyltransferase